VTSPLPPADRTRIEEVLDFWFGPVAEDGSVSQEHSQKWFSVDPEFDRMIQDRFGDLVERAGREQLGPWTSEPRGTLAVVLVCDQFPRNIRRGTARAWELDPKARQIAQDAIEAGVDGQLRAVERGFLYMPFMHAEDLALQERSVELFSELAHEAPPGARKLTESFRHHAHKHRDVVARFGRFPHRNDVLERQSTEEERQFLAAGKPFG
jgi:uncharacterized protein (DUF924 family)